MKNLISRWTRSGRFFQNQGNLPLFPWLRIQLSWCVSFHPPVFLKNLDPFFCITTLKPLKWTIKTFLYSAWSNTINNLTDSEATARRYSSRKHLCWSQFLIKSLAWRHTNLLKIDSNTGVFLWTLQKFYEQTIWKISANGYFRNFSKPFSNLLAGWSNKNSPSLLWETIWWVKKTWFSVINHHKN